MSLKVIVFDRESILVCQIPFSGFIIILKSAAGMLRLQAKFGADSIDLKSNFTLVNRSGAWQVSRQAMLSKRSAERRVNVYNSIFILS